MLVEQFSTHLEKRKRRTALKYRPKPSIFMRLAQLVLTTIVLGGCAAPVSETGFGGSFTESVTQSDIETFRERMNKQGAEDVLIMESFPPQFQVKGLGENCERARAEADSLPYVRSVSASRNRTLSAN